MPAFVDTGLNVVHVDDVAAGHLLAWRQGALGERYVLGGENFPLAEIFGGNCPDLRPQAADHAYSPCGDYADCPFR